MEQIKAPFSQEQVDKLNQFQKTGKFHPFTCCSPEYIPECKRALNQGETYEEREGILIAKTEGFICPCGKYKQNWAYAFMADGKEPELSGSEEETLDDDEDTYW